LTYLTVLRPRSNGLVDAWLLVLRLFPLLTSRTDWLLSLTLHHISRLRFGERNSYLDLTLAAGLARAGPSFDSLLDLTRLLGSGGCHSSGDRDWLRLVLGPRYE
jgi:hypothetical protein